jgi:Ca-activated chloride channel family protein
MCLVIVGVDIMKRIILLFMLCLPMSNLLFSYSYFVDRKAKEAWDKKDYEYVLNELKKTQVDHPDDARLNFNIANAYYRLGQFKNAQLNYERAVNYCADTDCALKERAYFNWGNSFYKNVLQMLPDGWEKKETKIDDKKLDVAIQETKSSIEKFKNALLLRKENKRAEQNKKQAEELLKKLENKKQKQQQQQDQQQKNEQKKQEQQQEQKNQQQQDQQQKQDQTSSDSKDKQQDRDKQQDQKKEGSDQREQQDGRGQDDKFDDKKEAQGKQDKRKDSHDQPSEKKDEQEQPEPQDTKGKEEKQELEQMQQEQAAQSGQEVGPEEHQKRRMAAILDNLQADESKKQKGFIRQKSKGKEPPLSGKNW